MIQLEQDFSIINILYADQQLIIYYFHIIAYNVQHKQHSEDNDNGIIETDGEESAILTEEVDPDSEPRSPLKIATALEEKITPSSSRKGRKPVFTHNLIP